MDRLVCRTRICFVVCLCAATVTALTAQTFTTLVSFNGSNGATPSGWPLVLGADGNLYGTTFLGGASSNCTYGCGTVFRITPGGTLTTLHSFSGGTDGLGPNALLQSADGSFYGTAQGGGADQNGTIFKITPGGTLTTVYSFTGATDGSAPGALVQGTDGNFYGTTSGLGEFGQFVGIEPTIFKITPGGTLTTLYRSDATDGSAPGELVQATDGNFYGTTSGMNIDGTIFKITPGGTLTTLYSFCRQGSIPYCPDGDGPGPLVQATDGDFYGTTFFGGVPNAGTIFKITPGGTLTTLYSFSGYTDGFGPGALLQAADGSFYGTTYGLFEPYPYGTIFKFPPSGPVTTLYGFNGGSDPGALVQAAHGRFYGTTQVGGAGPGTVFRLALGSQGTLSISPGGVVNDASYTAPVVPGSIAAAFGSFLLAAPVTDNNSHLLTSLSGLSLQFENGLPAPLFYAGAGQVNFQVPWELAGQSQTTLAAALNGASSTAQAVSLAALAPAIFSENAEGTGQGAILNSSYELADSTNPATAGSTYVLIFCTGLGAVTNQPANGSPAPGNPLSWTTTVPTVMIGGAPSTDVSFYGLAPGYVGLYQVNALVPAASSNGNAVPVTISIGGATSNTVTIAVQ